MTDTSADDAPPPAIHRSAARRRSAGIYGTIVASAVLAAGGAHLRTVPLAVTVVVTLLVYWAAEGYAELLGEHAHAGRLPTRRDVRASLAAIWPMVSASYLSLLALLAARVLGADTKTAATVALVVAIALLLVQGWVGGRASQLRGLPLLAVTLIAGAFGVVMILLKLLVTHCCADAQVRRVRESPTTDDVVRGGTGFHRLWERRPEKEAQMADLIAIGYPDETTALSAMDEAERLQQELIIQADAVAAIIRNKEGKLRVVTNHHAVGAGATWGMFWGMLFGMLFFVPFLGMAVGAGMGALMGKVTKSAVDKQFEAQVREMLQPGTSALFMVVEKVTPDKAVAALSRYGGTVLKSSLSNDAQRELQEALHGEGTSQ